MGKEKTERCLESRSLESRILSWGKVEVSGSSPVDAEDAREFPETSTYAPALPKAARHATAPRASAFDEAHYKTIVLFCQ